jgi:hypothetical protein
LRASSRPPPPVAASTRGYGSGWFACCGIRGGVRSEAVEGEAELLMLIGGGHRAPLLLASDTR